MYMIIHTLNISCMVLDAPFVAPDSPSCSIRYTVYSADVDTKGDLLTRPSHLTRPPTPLQFPIPSKHQHQHQHQRPTRETPRELHDGTIDISIRLLSTRKLNETRSHVGRGLQSSPAQKVKSRWWMEPVSKTNTCLLLLAIYSS